jgi:pimeloyl-ACP methyl ester carboxylesterase
MLGVHGRSSLIGPCGKLRKQTPSMNMFRSLLASVLLLLSQPAISAACADEDYELRVSGVSQCLLMRRFGALEPDTMVVWLHGDVSSGGPANYHFAIAQQAATQFSQARVLSVALVRPGYPDGSGETSTVALLHSGRSDHYSRENLSEVGAAIERLRARFKPKLVVVVGHSGGAATAAVLLGLKPRLIDAAVLVACPCDLVAWRAGRREWGRSENPIKWVDQVDATARVIALTGSKDDNTLPDLARAYVDALRSRGVDAVVQVLADETHNSAFRSPEVLNAVRRLLPPN